MNGLNTFHLPAASWGPQLAMMEAAGVTTVRSDAPWAVVEPEPSNATDPPYDFSSIDLWVAQLAVHGLTWMPILDDTPWWAKTCVGMCPPLNMTWYANFAKAAAARYGNGGTFWAQNPQLPYHPVQFFEIWNEENGTQFWSTGPSASQYAAMYSQARTAIQAVDPQAQVIVGGLGTGDALDFVQGMLAADPGLRGNIDGFGLHPYADSAADAMQLVVQFREGLDTLGEGSVPIDLTEFGWPQGVGDGNEASRAQMMRQFATSVSSSNCGVGILAPYSWSNDPTDPPDFALAGPTALLSSGAAWFAGLQSASGLSISSLCPPSSGASGQEPTSSPAASGQEPTSAAAASGREPTSAPRRLSLSVKSTHHRTKAHHRHPAAAPHRHRGSSRSAPSTGDRRESHQRHRGAARHRHPGLSLSLSVPSTGHRRESHHRHRGAARHRHRTRA
jgi:hypothetical protein